MTGVDAGFMESVLEGLVGFDTSRGDERPAAEFLRDRLAELGLEASLQEIGPGRANAVGVLRGTGGGRRLLLSGHLDTTPTGPHPGTQPRAVRDGDRLIGLGSFNMKSGLAAAVGAVQALVRSGERLRGDVVVAGVAGEIEKTPVEEFEGPEYEGGGLGTDHLVRHGVLADAAIVAEPTWGAITLGHMGAVWFRLRIHGENQHTAMTLVRPPVNAIEQAAILHRAILDWAPEYQERTATMGLAPGVAVTAIRGGRPWFACRTPIVCDMYLDVRLPPPLTPLEVVREVEQVVRRAEAEHAGLRVDVEPYLTRPATLLDESEEIVGVVSRAAEALTGAAPERRLRGPMDDTGSLIAAGVPAVSFGLGAANLAAGSDAPVGEWISLPELPRLAEIYVEVARRFCA